MDDTIAAIGTAVGEGGIGIIRLSGPEALAVLEGLVLPARNKELAWEPWRLRHGRVVQPGSGETVDEVLAVWMPAPRTYTRQDVAEIHCHGGLLALRRVLGLCLAAGARLAEPGEFTLRAFLNGRIDLAQAEAVVDVVRARSQAGLALAVEQMGGALSRPVSAVRAHLLAALAHLEAANDFPEDEIPPCDVAATLHEAERALSKLLAGAEMGMALRQGWRCAIVGRPNVGKSSLLNALLRCERAIVTPVPGTTRDTIEETAVIGGVPVVLVDTAGINETDDPVERLGVERSRQVLAGADLVLLVVDGSEAVSPADRTLAEQVRGRPTVLTINKSDLPLVAEVEGLLPEGPTVWVSARTGEGLPALERAVMEAVMGAATPADDQPVVSRPRHVEALRRAQEQVRAAQRALAQAWPADCIGIEIGGAVAALGEITGETVTDDLVARIFAEFCLGK
ncbi:MAG: tRNA uridine-5-carboxymethylaminomethyl(34) synthesis GTPase MnmE [Anaerolineae bacterium]